MKMTMLCPKISIFLFIVTINVVRVCSTPHKKISQVIEELKLLGFQSVTSCDDFKNSLKCGTCGVTLSFGKTSQAVWILRRHTMEGSHQVKAGWFLDQFNNVVKSKPKGKLHYM